MHGLQQAQKPLPDNVSMTTKRYLSDTVEKGRPTTHMQDGPGSNPGAPPQILQRTVAFVAMERSASFLARFLSTSICPNRRPANAKMGRAANLFVARTGAAELN
jgi:hypothetical protein